MDKIIVQLRYILPLEQQKIIICQVDFAAHILNMIFVS